MNNPSIYTFRFDRFRIDNFSLFTNHDQLQISGAYSDGNKLQVCTFRASYAVLNELLRTKLPKSTAFKLMTAIGTALSNEENRWESVNVSEVLGENITIETLGVITSSQPNKSVNKPLIHSFFNYKQQNFS
ncbi:hypothetical protein [Sanyastnella coralliicola]|uniref:hypothetical protein n=1 Tax=Sanyastnella coralliicola TaxID=3069118 RepID=UPI0027B89300|nr:hypothetical protein [Longitalea sp. SCSIO 12813]